VGKYVVVKMTRIHDIWKGNRVFKL
jgi:hypothetical protein